MINTALLFQFINKNTPPNSWSVRLLGSPEIENGEQIVGLKIAEKVVRSK